MERCDFLARRRAGIGGSDAGIILGVNPWKTPYQLWLDKTAQTPPVEEDNDILHFGQVLEQVVADEFSRRNQVKVHRVNSMYQKQGTPLIANIDRKIVDGGILECKTCDKFARSKFGEAGSDEVPETYLIQVQHYMHVTGYHEAVLAVLIGGNEYRQYPIAYDAELAEFSAAKCCEWWTQYVIGNVPPPPSVNDNLTAYYQATAGATVTATPEIVAKIADLQALKAEIKRNSDEMDTLAAEVKIFAGNAEIILDAAVMMGKLCPVCGRSYADELKENSSEREHPAPTKKRGAAPSATGRFFKSFFKKKE